MVEGPAVPVGTKFDTPTPSSRTGRDTASVRCNSPASSGRRSAAVASGWPTVWLRVIC